MSDRNLKGRVAVVTGASRGLGKAMAAALVDAGATVAMVAREPERLAAAAQETGGIAFAADLTDEGAVNGLERRVREALGPADILVNNAGINIRKPVTELALEEWNRVMASNCTSAFLMARAFVPAMKGRGYGRIINVASTMAHVSLPNRAAYSASKAALLGLTRALALEVAADAITVVSVSPGPFATEMNTALLEDPAQTEFFTARVPVGRWGKVEELGGLIVYLCSDSAAFITGSDIPFDGGWCTH